MCVRACVRAFLRALHGTARRGVARHGTARHPHMLMYRKPMVVPLLKYNELAPS